MEANQALAALAAKTSRLELAVVALTRHIVSNQEQIPVSTPNDSTATSSPASELASSVMAPEPATHFCIVQEQSVERDNTCMQELSWHDSPVLQQQHKERLAAKMPYMTMADLFDDSDDMLIMVDMSCSPGMEDASFSELWE